MFMIISSICIYLFQITFCFKKIGKKPNMEKIEDIENEKSSIGSYLFVSFIFEYVLWFLVKFQIIMMKGIK